MTPQEAAKILLAGDIVAIPTETVYGLAADIRSEQALKKVFATKQRPFFDPLIVHVLDIHQAQDLVTTWPKEIKTLTEKFWPGPLTVVLPKTEKIHHLITGELETVGLRAPAHPLAREVIEQVGPLAAPSANKFGRTSPTRAEHVVKEFEGQVPVLDGGACDVGVESTVVRWDAARNSLEILRPGGISQSRLLDALKLVNSKAQVVRATSQASPGHLEQHYQPRLPLILAQGPGTPSVHQALADKLKMNVRELHTLELPPQPELAARELYHRLHVLGQHSQGALVYWQGPEWLTPEWDAIRDRLQRASTPL